MSKLQSEVRQRCPHSKITWEPWEWEHDIVRNERKYLRTGKCDECGQWMCQTFTIRDVELMTLTSPDDVADFVSNKMAEAEGTSP